MTVTGAPSANQPFEDEEAHYQHHRGLEGAVATAESLGLGKYVAVGYEGLPTWIDPAADDWADVVANDFGWVQFAYGLPGDAVDVLVGRGDGESSYANLAIDTNGAVTLYISSDGGQVYMKSFPGGQGSKLQVSPGAGQTGELFALGAVLDVGVDGAIGSVTPNDGDVLTWDAGSGSIKWAAP